MEHHTRMAELAVTQTFAAIRAAVDERERDLLKVQFHCGCIEGHRQPPLKVMISLPKVLDLHINVDVVNMDIKCALLVLTRRTIAVRKQYVPATILVLVASWLCTCFLTLRELKKLPTPNGMKETFACSPRVLQTC